MGSDHDQLLVLAVSVAEEAGKLLLDGIDRVRTLVETKSTGTDMVTEMDRASERLIAERLHGARPDDGFLGEEGTSEAGSTGVRWVVDPLDGTTNYLYGHAPWAVSIAAEADGAAVVGVVHDPTHGETFAATAGGGATLNGRRLAVVGASSIATALIGTGFSYDGPTRGRQASTLVELLPKVRDVRRSGSAAVDLCWVAAGRLDAYYEWGLQPWDRAAGALIAAEAGATTALLDDGTTVAAAPHLFDPLLDLLTS